MPVTREHRELGYPVQERLAPALRRGDPAVPAARSGLLSLGAEGFYFTQVTGDSGAGATLGDFKGMTAGLGPVLVISSRSKAVAGGGIEVADGGGHKKTT